MHSCNKLLEIHICLLRRSVNYMGVNTFAGKCGASWWFALLMMIVSQEFVMADVSLPTSLVVFDEQAFGWELYNLQTIVIPTYRRV